MPKEFKEFAFKGNVVDMAVGIIIGAAFSTMVRSLVDDIVTVIKAKAALAALDRPKRRKPHRRLSNDFLLRENCLATVFRTIAGTEENSTAFGILEQFSFFSWPLPSWENGFSLHSPILAADHFGGRTMQANEASTDVVIIGAGPVGFAVFRPDCRAAPDTVNKVRAFQAQCLVKFELGQPSDLKKRDGKFEAVVVKRPEGATFDIEAGALLPFFGLTMKLRPIVDFGLNLHENLIPADTAKFETSTPGLFAIGDINSYPGKLKLILSGFHEAALMAQAAHRYVHPEKVLRFQYTTSSSELQRLLKVA
jgi:hypothetical protein